ncbi:molecular chaperone HscB [Microdochium nivale]|nr:molecular chaperone HscB [Microdochium nivale]
MRTALLPRSRHAANRICEACRHHHQRAVSTAASRIVAASPSQQQSQLPSPTPAAKLAAPRQPPTRFLSTSAPRAHPPDSPGDSTTTTTTASSTTTTATTETPPPPPQSHYDLFPQTLPLGPPPRGAFAIDQRALRREFLQLQAKAHPDLHPPHMKSRAEATSARINEAYKTLSSPLLRAQYLLDRHFATAPAGSPSTHPASDEAASVDDPELLMQVLEAREVIEEAQSEAELAGLKAENDERVRDSEHALGVHLAAGDVESAKHECVRLRYWTNIADTLHHWEKGKPIVLEH